MKIFLKCVLVMHRMTLYSPLLGENYVYIYSQFQGRLLTNAYYILDPLMWVPNDGIFHNTDQSKYFSVIHLLVYSILLIAGQSWIRSVFLEHILSQYVMFVKRVFFQNVIVYMVSVVSICSFKNSLNWLSIYMQIVSFKIA